jgi:ribose transport system ATP-binding protein
MNNSKEMVLECHSLNKEFPGVKALDQVDFSVFWGEVHALIGENGAGKSTLIKILGGIYTPDSGDIYFKKKALNIHSPRQAQDLGIALIHQELNLVPVLTVAENIFLGREIISEKPLGRVLGKMFWRQLFTRTGDLLKQFGIESIDPHSRVSDLSIAQQQMVEIIRALSMDASLLIMDEPTTALSPEEVAHLFNMIKTLKNQGVSIIFISHRLDEVFYISDRISVLRDGRHVGTKVTKETSIEEIVNLMVGREIKNRYPKELIPIGPVLLEVKQLTRNKDIQNISFKLHQGEILGLIGLLGSGRTEVARAIFGADRIENGNIVISGKPVRIQTPLDAIHHGIALVPEDRKNQGLIINLTVRENISLANLDQLEQPGRLDKKKEKIMVEKFINQLNIRTPNINTQVRYLSGGNQQKVVLAKWLCRKSRIFIFDEPTKGIDVAAKVEVYRLIEALAKEGAGIIFISSELPEVMALCDRILVMREGSITAEFNHQEVTQEKIMMAATVGVQP